MIKSREFIWVLFKRDFFAQYKKSFFGVGWMVLSPIIGIISWVFMQMTGLLNPGDIDIPYPVYVLIGTSMWGLYMGFFGAGATTLTAGASLVFQVDFSHEALLLKQLASLLASFLITFILNIIVLLLFGILPSWKIIFFPFVILPMFFLGAGIGLIVSMISVVAMDLTKIINFAHALVFFFTPVIYSGNIEDLFKDNEYSSIVQLVIKFNPLTYLVCSARDIIIYGELYNIKGYFISAIVSFILFFLAWRLFYISEKTVIERMI